MADAQQQLAFSKRGPKDIWEGLYEFPLEEFDSQEHMQAFLEGKSVVGAKFQHLLTHQKIEAYFVRTPLKAHEAANYLLLGLHELEEHPIPRLIDKFLNAHSSELF